MNEVSENIKSIAVIGGEMLFDLNSLFIIKLNKLFILAYVVNILLILLKS